MLTSLRKFFSWIWYSTKTVEEDTPLPVDWYAGKLELEFQCPGIFANIWLHDNTVIGLSNCEIFIKLSGDIPMPAKGLYIMALPWKLTNATIDENRIIAGSMPLEIFRQKYTIQIPRLKKLLNKIIKPTKLDQ